MLVRDREIKEEKVLTWLSDYPRDDCIVILLIVCVTIKMYFTHSKHCICCVDQRAKRPFNSILIPVGSVISNIALTYDSLLEY